LAKVLKTKTIVDKDLEVSGLTKKTKVLMGENFRLFLSYVLLYFDTPCYFMERLVV
jgi:hypothetical protein